VRRHIRSGVFAGVAALAVVPAPGVVSAGDLSSQRTLGLERGLDEIRRDLRGPQRNTDFELDRARRRLRDLEVERPRDPDILHLEREIDGLEIESERIERHRALERSLERSDVGRTRLPPPDFLRPPYDIDLSGDELPIGTGKQFILIRNSLRRANAQLSAGHLGAASRHLATAESGMANLKAAPEGKELAADPNVVATEREIADLRARLDAARAGG